MEHEWDFFMVGKASIFRISSGVNERCADKIVDAKNQDIGEDQHKLIEH